MNCDQYVVMKYVCRFQLWQCSMLRIVNIFYVFMNTVSCMLWVLFLFKENPKTLKLSYNEEVKCKLLGRQNRLLRLNFVHDHVKCMDVKCEHVDFEFADMKTFSSAQAILLFRNGNTALSLQFSKNNLSVFQWVFTDLKSFVEWKRGIVAVFFLSVFCYYETELKHLNRFWKSENI